MDYDSFIVGGDEISAEKLAEGNLPEGVKDRAIEIKKMDITPIDLNNLESASTDLVPVNGDQTPLAQKMKKHKTKQITALSVSIISGLATFITPAIMLPKYVDGLIGLEFFLVSLLIVAIIICINNRKNANQTYKQEIVRRALSQQLKNVYYHSENQNFRTNFLESLDFDPYAWKSVDLMTADPKTITKTLYLGAKQWNIGNVSDEFTAERNGAKFRFMDYCIERLQSNGKSTTRILIFRGHLYIFPILMAQPDAIHYVPYASLTSPMLSDFINCFHARKYDPNEDPHIEKSFFSKLFGNSDNDGSSGEIPYKREFENEELMECLLRLNRILVSDKWSVRLLRDCFVLILNKPYDVFENSMYSDMDKEVLPNLQFEVAEVFQIADIISEYASKHPV